MAKLTEKGLSNAIGSAALNTGRVPPDWKSSILKARVAAVQRASCLHEGPTAVGGGPVEQEHTQVVDMSEQAGDGTEGKTRKHAQGGRCLSSSKF